MGDRTFPGLPFRVNQGRQAVELLEHAVEVLKRDEPDESAFDFGARVKSAATIAVAATTELHTLAGYCEAAGAADEAGLLDTEGADP